MSLLGILSGARERHAARNVWIAPRRARRGARFGLEALEGRVVLSTVGWTPDRVPIITGTDARDVVQVRDDATGKFAVISEFRDGRWVELARHDDTLARSGPIRVRLLGGNDEFRNYSNSARTAVEGGAGDDLIVGGNGADTLWGDSSTDRLGVVGNDSVSGMGGRDEIFGGPGNDYLNGDGAGSYANPNSYGNDLIYGMQGDDTVVGDLGDDHLNGDWIALAPGMSPSAVDRALMDGQGRDKISGGDGADRMYGGAGNDNLYGYGGDDRADGGLGRDEIFGGAGGDTLVGNEDNDQLLGEQGEDVLYGELGNDYMDGGDHDDALFGGYGSDLIRGGYGNDRIFGEWGDDALHGEGYNDTIDGGDGDDTIRGGDGDDILLGQAGGDTIEGGNGNDRMVGAAGNDNFDRRAWYDRAAGVAGGNDVILTAGHQDDFTHDYAYNDGGDAVLGGSGDTVGGRPIAFDYSTIADDQGFTLGFAFGGGAGFSVAKGMGIGFAQDGVFTYESTTESYGLVVGIGVSVEFTIAPTRSMNSFAGHNHGAAVGVDLVPGLSFTNTHWYTDDGRYAGVTLALELGLGLAPVSVMYQSQTTTIKKLI